MGILIIISLYFDPLLYFLYEEEEVKKKQHFTGLSDGHAVYFHPPGMNFTRHGRALILCPVYVSPLYVLRLAAEHVGVHKTKAPSVCVCVTVQSARQTALWRARCSNSGDPSCRPGRRSTSSSTQTASSSTPSTATEPSSRAKGWR